MGKMIQIRHVPEDIHSRLKARAALAQMSLSDYLLKEITRIAERPTVEEVLQRLQHRKPVPSTISPADLLRAERERV